jgi:hypothetical protein
MDQAADRQAPLDPFQHCVLRLVVGWSAHDAILKILEEDPERNKDGRCGRPGRLSRS